MSIRTERVARLIQRDIADLLNTEFAEQVQPMATVTGARVTKDLSIAYVYVSFLGETEAMRQAAFRHLKELTPQIRAALARRIRHQVRKIPEIKFFLDDTLEQARHMEALLARIREERERRDPDA
ncbi:30S ribosome-binding factor RbfA [Rhodocaloribacter sp.]|jgi:ribosome-binding factor A